PTTPSLTDTLPERDATLFPYTTLFRSEVVKLLSNLQAARPLARDDLRIIERCHEGCAGLVLDCTCLCFSIRMVFSEFDNLRPVLLYDFYLFQDSSLRHYDGALFSQHS